MIKAALEMALFESEIPHAKGLSIDGDKLYYTVKGIVSMLDGEQVDDDIWDDVWIDWDGKRPQPVCDGVKVSYVLRNGTRGSTRKASNCLWVWQHGSKLDASEPWGVAKYKVESK